MLKVLGITIIQRVYPVNLQNFNYKYVYIIRVKNNVDPENKIASPEAYQDWQYFRMDEFWFSRTIVDFILFGPQRIKTDFVMQLTNKAADQSAHMRNQISTFKGFIILDRICINQNSLGQFRVILCNQISDMHRGST